MHIEYHCSRCGRLRVVKYVDGSPFCPEHGDLVTEISLSSSPVTDAVIEDLRNRNKLGMERYGRILDENTYEDNLREAYEELLDACQYLKAELMRRRNK